MSLPPIRAELYRLVKTRSTWVLLLLPPLAAALRLFGGRLLLQLEQARRAAEGLGSGEVTEAINGFGPFADGLRTGAMVLTLTTLILGALSLVKDRENGALGISFLARSRGAIVLARGFGVAFFAAIGFAVLFLASWGLATYFYDLGPILLEGVPLATEEELWADVRRGVGSSILPVIAAGLFGLFVSSLSTATGSAVAGTLVPFVMFDIFKGLLEDKADYVFVTYVPFLGSGSSLAELTEMARGYSTEEWTEGLFERALWVPTISGVAILVLAVLLTRWRSA